MEVKFPGLGGVKGKETVLEEREIIVTNELRLGGRGRTGGDRGHEESE